MPKIFSGRILIHKLNTIIIIIIIIIIVIFLTYLGPTQPPTQWVLGALSLRLKWREADHSPPSSAEVNNAWSYTSAPPVRLHGVLS
jgi:hypothetical protein